MFNIINKKDWELMKLAKINTNGKWQKKIFMMCKLYIAPFVDGIINLGRSLLSLPVTFALNSVVLNNPFTAIHLIYVVGVNTSLSLWYGNQMSRNFFMWLMYITCMCFVVRPEWPAVYRDVLKLIIPYTVWLSRFSPSANMYQLSHWNTIDCYAVGFIF